MLKSIRRGEWTERQVLEYFEAKRVDLEAAKAKSVLPPVPDEAAIRDLLLRCLERHYGDLAGCVVEPDRAVAALRSVQAALDGVRDLL